MFGYAKCLDMQSNEYHYNDHEFLFDNVLMSYLLHKLSITYVGTIYQWYVDRARIKVEARITSDSCTRN